MCCKWDFEHPSNQILIIMYEIMFHILFQVQENATHVKSLPDVSNINVELSKETLDTMLDGLTKIRDQLSSVAKR